MDRNRKQKESLDGFFFASPEQKLLRFLLTEPTTTFTPRVLSSKLKGVRGLGGVEGIKKILGDLSEMEIIHFVDNNKAVRLNNDLLPVRLMKGFSAICDLEDLIQALREHSSKVILLLR